MSSEPLLSSIIPFAGSGLLGYAMGFALKKVLKLLLLAIGTLITTDTEARWDDGFRDNAGRSK